jgi:hypothetical protein
MLIFISHSHKDVDLASSLAKFITTVLKIESDEVRCTSVPGYEISCRRSAESRGSGELSG